MATLRLTITPATAQVGTLLTARYDFEGTGSQDEPAINRDLTITGAAALDGEQLTASGTITITKPAINRTRTYETPVLPGVTFQPTADPAVFTGIAALA